MLFVIYFKVISGHQVTQACIRARMSFAVGTPIYRDPDLFIVLLNLLQAFKAIMLQFKGY